MNSYQIAFLAFMLLPPILSIALDKLSNRIKGLGWIEWYEIIIAFYLLGTIIALIVKTYLILGKL